MFTVLAGLRFSAFDTSASNRLEIYVIGKNLFLLTGRYMSLDQSSAGSKKKLLIFSTYLFQHWRPEHGSVKLVWNHLLEILQCGSGEVVLPPTPNPISNTDRYARVDDRNWHTQIGTDIPRLELTHPDWNLHRLNLATNPSLLDCFLGGEIGDGMLRYCFTAGNRSMDAVPMATKLEVNQ